MSDAVSHSCTQIIMCHIIETIADAVKDPRSCKQSITGVSTVCHTGALHPAHASASHLLSLLLIIVQIWSVATGWNGFVIPSNGCAIKIIGVCQRKCWIQPTELVPLLIGWTPGFPFLNSLWVLSFWFFLRGQLFFFPWSIIVSVWEWTLYFLCASVHAGLCAPWSYGAGLWVPQQGFPLR